MLALSAVIGTVGLGARHASAKGPMQATAITKPSMETKLSFRSPDIVLQIPIREGQTVKAGDLLVALDDRQEAAELAAMKIEAYSDLPIKEAEVKFAAAEVELKRQDEMRKNNVTTETEFRKAELELELARIQVDAAKQDVAEKKEKTHRQELRVAEMKMISPMNGTVKNIDVNVGQVIDPSKPAITLVSNEPLWVEMYLPTRQAQQLKADQKINVGYDRTNWESAKVIFIDPVADAASDTQMVRLELANPSGKSAGLQMNVQLPAEVADADTKTPAAH